MSKRKQFATILSSIVSSARTRGLWYGLTLAAVMLRVGLRRWFGSHHRHVIAAAMVGLFILGTWVLGEALQSPPPADKFGVVAAPIIVAVSLSSIAAGLGYFVLQHSLIRQVWMRCLNGIFVAVCVAALGYAAFDNWKAFYQASPAASVYVALLLCLVVFGFRDVFVWFLRSLLIRDITVLDTTDLPSLSAEGRYRVAVHEAGHAICYGLTTAVPEDAYACIDADFSSMVLGAVVIPTPRDPTEITKERMEWSMLMTMAGVAAERCVLGESSLNGTGDVAAMTNLANAYLAAGHGEVIDPAPADELSVSANRAAIGRLREHYTRLAESFVQENRHLCEEFARLLEASEYVDCTSIADIVGNVTLPAGWKRMAWGTSVATIPFRKSAS